MWKRCPLCWPHVQKSGAVTCLLWSKIREEERQETKQWKQTNRGNWDCPKSGGNEFANRLWAKHNYVRR